jgi:hypothetical protein
MTPRPITYRAEIIQPILTSIAAGECCSIVGISGAGKSNMMQHLLRPEVVAHYLGDRAEQLRFVIVDANLLAEWSAWGFFEGLYDHLLSAVKPEVPPDVASGLQTAHAQILASTGHYATALRSCVDLIGLLCDQMRLVLLFDEFDPLFAQLSEQVLRNLRGLRDRYKYRLMYLTFTRQPLVMLRDDQDWEIIEPFVELLSLGELGLRPLCQTDAIDEVARFAHRHQRALDPMLSATIAELSGGHPALLRALVQQELIAPGTVGKQNERLHLLPVIRLECAKIWQQLTGGEQAGLLQSARGLAAMDTQTQLLLLKGLVCQPQNHNITIFSPILAAYLTTVGESSIGQRVAPIDIDQSKQIIQYYGRDVTGEIAPREYLVLAHLWEHRDRICSVMEVARIVEPNLPNDIAEDIELEWCRVMMRRLRSRLAKLASGQPVPLLIYRKLGYRLLEKF